MKPNEFEGKMKKQWDLAFLNDVLMMKILGGTQC